MIPHHDTLPVNGLTKGGMVYIHTAKAVDEDSDETGDGTSRNEPETSRNLIKLAVELFGRLV